MHLLCSPPKDSLPSYLQVSCIFQIHLPQESSKEYFDPLCPAVHYSPSLFLGFLSDLWGASPSKGSSCTLQPNTTEWLLSQHIPASLGTSTFYLPTHSSHLSPGPDLKKDKLEPRGKFYLPVNKHLQTSVYKWLTGIWKVASTSLITREMKIKTIMRYHLTPFFWGGGIVILFFFN